MLKTFDLAGHAVGIMINRDIDSGVLDQIIAVIKERLEIYESVNVYIELTKKHGITPRALLKGIKFKYSNEDLFGKIAIVTDNKWFQNTVNVTDIFLNVEVQTYNLENRLEAIQWISI